MRLLFLLIPLAMSLGCGDDRIATYPVSGRVQFADGRPVRHGTIEFESIEHGTTATGKILHDGSFVLGTYTPDDGAAEGTHHAIVLQLVIADGAFKHTVDHGKAVPVKYGDYKTSSLDALVKAEEENEVVITLQE